MERLYLDFDLPPNFQQEERRASLLKRVRRVTVLEMLRDGEVSQGWAADTLGVSRTTLFTLMGEKGVSPFDLSPEEVAGEARRAAEAFQPDRP